MGSRHTILDDRDSTGGGASDIEEITPAEIENIFKTMTSGSKSISRAEVASTQNDISADELDNLLDQM